ncbi:hypothetical protein EOPP23_12035 [Endozoicomonas sp. OPT23]|uniref:pilus assembly PilX family protein n=1 Tax=Endozoicomonas sp. OPT23 TaxID=2072845 RepID=UPI00129BC222|nr:pilus assembly protein [Endozoicomonas sp. OPT23]MRI33716.1 hypothetical protein [Endozoicomonas sp. OPT23]
MKEQGSVLLVSLVLLMVLTIAGVSSIRLSGLQEKMTASYHHEQLDFRVAEVGILEAENFVTDTFISAGSFSSDCTNGLCFSGSGAADPGVCIPGSSKPWESEAVWNNARSASITLTGHPSVAKYIVELRCYLPREIDGPDPDPLNLADWATYYRITVLAAGVGNRSRVMLQTTYKKNL